MSDKVNKNTKYIRISNLIVNFKVAMQVKNIYILENEIDCYQFIVLIVANTVPSLIF